MSPSKPQLFIHVIMLEKPKKKAVKLEKLDSTLTAAVAPHINGVSYEEQLLGELL